ncbi:hypothetical protein V7S43_014068 [Phytophthora oleae]|uniref:Dynein heavy chain hydrolytic ATP-binding dynein motor region domain-containing protein n=1 Tax=Phytophthora oleae TaxID=2107226 RepID=A0ABD3F2L6_9STRA
METAGARAGSAPRRQPKPSSQAREDAAETFKSLSSMSDAVPLVNRLHLNWQSVPVATQAKLYTPSTNNNRPPSAGASSNKRLLSPLGPSTSVVPARKHPQRSSAVESFEQKYASEDPLMRYVLHVIHTGSPVRRSKIPREKYTRRRVRPEEDVLYLVPCETPPCGFRNVYWLTFAEEGTVLRHDHASSFEYFTLGSQGFTRFKGDQGVEFADLAGWLDEKRAFDQMTNMKGLKRIQQMIFFFSWKRRAVQRRLHRVKERLVCSLFTCHPLAAQLLMDVRDVCIEIEYEAEREYVEADTSYTLERLSLIYRERLRTAKTAISKKIYGLCAAIDDATRDISRYKEDQGCSYAITDHESFSRTLRLSSLRERMFTFLRLVDCHVAEAVYQHVTLVVRDLRERICGESDSIQPISVEERRGNLCRSESTEHSGGSTLSAHYQRVNYTVQVQESDVAVVAVPGLYVSLRDDVDFEGDVSSAAMYFVPAKVEVLELVHTILMKYCVAMDGLPRILMDKHFQHVLTPFVPSLRRDFAESLLKPSHLVLESFEPELRGMRTAVDLHSRRIGILQQEHLRCVRAIKVAERESPVETTRRESVTEVTETDEEDGRLPELPDLSSSAAAYELAQKTWDRFVQYANNAAPMLQVGYLLLDQRSFVDRLRGHVSKRVAEMDDALPVIYQQFLSSLLEDVDGRIEKVTKIPTNLAEANKWLAQVTSMMSTHPFRQRLDAKIANLARLRILIKEHGLMSLEPEVQDTIRKLELTWESVIETLLLCLARVEERESEHRRSVHDVITKVDEYITSQLQSIIKTFEELPAGCEDEDEVISCNSASTQEDLVLQLEDLVAMDIERKNVVLQFEEYDREHRAVLDMPPVQHTAWSASLSSSSSESLSAVSLTDKLPSELLLLYIITSLELRQWYESWKKLQDKWLGSPLNGVHPGAMINRIKQFRRRLGHASSRLARLSSVLVQTLPLEQSLTSTEDEDKKECASFAKKDLKLMKAFDCSIEEMLNCNRIFQAITGGAFSDARWAAMNQLLNVHSGAAGGSHFTLRQMKEKCGADQLEAFLGVCDECIVEAKLHVKLEQARQRLARIEVRVEETNYSVRCERVPETLALLDDIAVDLKLCLFGQNPELHLCLELRAVLERKTAVCEHILTYQKHWRLRCEATKLHEVDEFFSKRFSGGGDFVPRARKAQHKTGLKQEQSVWQLFLDASHAWSDRLRRLFFVSPHQAQVEQLKGNSRSLLGRKSAAPLTVSRRQSTATKTMDCTLDDVMESFKDFDFEATFAACERGMELVQSYLESLREKTPRLYCLDETTMLGVLLRDSDMKQLHQAFAICFPRVHRFSIARATNRVGSTIEVFGNLESGAVAPVRTKTDGTIVIVGLEGLGNAHTMEKSGRFRLPVAKIGRVKFWFTRLEEELASTVLTDMKQAFEWVTQDLDDSNFDSFLPQSIVTALGLRFTYEMNCALQHETLSQLHLLRDTLRERLVRLVAARNAEKLSTFVRLETMILLSAKQLEVLSHVIDLIEQEQQEEALFFWSMQFQTRVFVEVMLPGPNVQPGPGKHGKVERSELFPASVDFLKDSASYHAGQSTNMVEFIGWGRPTLLSPFTQRCLYALFSALRMHHTALVVPFSSSGSGTDPTSLLWGISEMLLRPCFEFSCDSNAGTTSTHQLGQLMNATSKLGGFLIVRHLLQLSAALVGVVRERMLQHFHQAAPVGTNSLVLPRYSGSSSYGASAVFIPLDSKEELHWSGLVQSIRTQFRAVAVTRPAIKYVVESVLLADGFVTQQIRELNVVEGIEAIEREASCCAFNMELLVFRVVQEARRLRAQYRVVWGPNPSTGRKNTMKTLLQPTVSSASELEIRDAQCVFHQAFQSTVKALLSDEERGRLDVLLARAFPLSSGGRLVTKRKGDEEAVAAAVTIYLESAFALPPDCGQFELILELWRALQTFPAALVYGAPGSGKTTCITALHRALVALELSKQSQENEQMGCKSSLPPAVTQLVILNPHLLTLDQFYSSISTACGTEVSSSLKWVLVDGEVDGGVLDRLVEGDRRACSSATALPSSSTLFRGLSGSVISANCSDTCSTRLLFEVTSLENLSPSTLRRCWTLHVPGRCITATSIVHGWRTRWETQLAFEPDTRGFEAMTTVFKTVDTLLLRICVRFVVDEATPDRNDSEVGTAGLKLGFLRLNHATQTALTMVSLCCLHNKSLLQELPYLRLVELVAFAVLWGFSGHLVGSVRLKLENYVRAKSKEFSETRHLAELPRSLVDAGHFEDVWDELQPRFTASFTAQPPTGAKHGVQAEVKLESAFDSSSGQILVLVPAAASLLRICTLFLYSSHSFLLVGPTASGKTSLLRWLMLRNRESEAEEMKVETSLDERHVHGILDWTRVPAAWFRPLKQRECGISSRAKMREDTELFAGRSRHSFVFLDDLDPRGEGANKTQTQYVRTMLDHRIGYSTKHGGFQPVEKHIGAGISLDDAGPSLPPVLDRFLRHFVVFQVPTYTQKELLSVFRIKFQRHFQPELSRGNTVRRLSVKSMGNGGQLPLEEVILRASVDFAAEMAAFQQLGQTASCLNLFSLHHANMLLERTLVFASGMTQRATSTEGTTLVQLGKAHQSWLSELQNIFLSNCLTEDATTRAEAREDSQKKLAGLLRHLSEKYFSVAFRGRDHSFLISVETLHFLVKLAEYHIQAPLLQPRLVQLRELLNEHMTAANGVSRRSSDQVRAAVSGVNSVTSPTELVSSVLLEIAATSTSSGAGNGKTKPYSRGQLTAIEMKLLLSSSWCLTQATHLIHALSQQQQIVLSSSQHGGLVAERLLRFACDLHSFKVHVVDDSASSQDQALRLVVSHAGVRQERVALWIRERQMTSCLVDLLQELCLGKFPSLALLPGGEELRDELVLSCIQARKQLEIVTETELMEEFQQRLQQNFRLCILQDNDVGENGGGVVHWMKTRPTCHWRRLALTDLELQRLVPEVANVALTSPALCGVAWELQNMAKYVLLCQNVHFHMIRSSPVGAGPASQLEYVLSFMTNVTVMYKAKLECHRKEIARLETGLETLTFARYKVVPTLERLKETLEHQSTQVDEELESIHVQQEAESPADEEDRWVLRSKYEELLMLSSETKLRLEDVSRFLAEWTNVEERMNDLFTKWTQELSQEQSKTDRELMGAALYVSAQRAYPHVTSFSMTKRSTCLKLLKDLLLDNIGDDCSLGIENRLVDDSEDDSKGVVRLIWESCFPFVSNPEIYCTIRLADDLCDRVPVFVDPSGVFQRFLVHTFSGHTLFSTLSGCGGAGDVESECLNASKESMVISCDDPKLESYMQEAVRLGAAVLLVNFRSKDAALLARLQPFLAQARFSHAPPRRSALQELTMRCYEDQRRQKQRRTSTSGSAMAAMSFLAQTAAVGASTARRARAGRHKSVALDPVAVAAVSNAASDAAKPIDRRSKTPTASGSELHFQIYAVTATPVPLETQHALTSQFAHFTVSVTDSDLETLFALPRVGKMQHSLLQELREEQIGVADCWVKRIQAQRQLEQLLETLKPATERDDSPFAVRRANQVTIQLQERYSELAQQLSREDHAKLLWSSREQSLQAKNGDLALASEGFASMASHLVGVARCMATMASLAIGTRASPFYLQNVRYLENATAQQLAAQGDDSAPLSAHGLAALLARISSGFVSRSHRQIFSFLETIQREIREGEASHWNEALVWLVTSCIRRSRVRDSSFNLQRIGRRNSLKWPGDSGASLVERLRRRVKLCAYLFNGWKASNSSKNASGKLRAVRPQTAVKSSPLDKTTDSDSAENKEEALAEVQRDLDKLLAESETLWYEWKTTRVRLQLDVENFIAELGFQDVASPSSAERNTNTTFPGAILLITLEEVSARFQTQTSNETTTQQHVMLSLLLAKALFPSSFAQTLGLYLQRYSNRALQEHEGTWTSWPSPASLVVDICPPRGKHTHAHLPRALIMYTPDERSTLELKLSTWRLAVFVDTAALREELIMLITTKHKFVLELLDANLAEAALSLVSQLINEHALLSVPEWYVIASFAVATRIENGKLAVLDRIAVLSSSQLAFDWNKGRSIEQVVRRKLVEECGASESAASALIQAVINGRRNAGNEVASSVVRDLEDLVLHLSNVEETEDIERVRRTNRLLRLLTARQNTSASTSSDTSTAALSSELLSDFLSVGESSLAMLVEGEEEEWLSRQPADVWTCERLWSSFCHVRALFTALGALPDDGASFFPWQSIDLELSSQLSAFEAVERHLNRLRALPTSADSHAFNRQQQLSTLARGYVPFDWAQSFFVGTAWPPDASGTVSIAQLLLLVACRLGVLVRCIRGDRAWAVNLAVVSDACTFLRCLRSYTAARTDVSESSLVLVLELDASDARNEEDETKKQALAIVKQLGGFTDRHGAVLHHLEAGGQSYGVRVEGLVLVSTTKLHPLPMCRIMCQLSVDSTVTDVPVVLLPSLSPYQPVPTIPRGPDTVRVLLSRSLNAVVGENSSRRESMVAVGVPVFPDDDSNE